MFLSWGGVFWRTPIPSNSSSTLRTLDCLRWVDWISCCSRSRTCCPKLNFVKAWFITSIKNFSTLIPLTLVWRASICWERPLKLPGQLNNCWKLTSSPTSLIKTCNSSSSSYFGIHKSLTIMMWHILGQLDLSMRKKVATFWATFNSCLIDWSWLRYSVTFSWAADNFSCRDFTNGLSCFREQIEFPSLKL